MAAIQYAKGPRYIHEAHIYMFIKSTGIMLEGKGLTLLSDLNQHESHDKMVATIISLQSMS